MTDSPLTLRTVKDTDTLRALADPLRLAILRLLMRNAHQEVRTWSVREIAGELGEPPPKLYRHVKQLEERGLIAVTGTRIVSGIIEHRYRTGQISLGFDPELLGTVGDTDQSSTMLAATFDEFGGQFAQAVRSGTVRLGVPGDPLSPVIASLDSKLPRARAEEFRRRLAELVDEFIATEHDGQGPAVRVLAAFYTV